MAISPMTERLGVMPANQHSLRDGMRLAVSGVNVVTHRLEGRPWGLTVSAFTSVCLEPPTLLVCVGNGTVTAAEVSRDGRFAVNLVSTDPEQVEIAKLCSRVGVPKFVDEYCARPEDLIVEGESDPPASPILRGAVVSFDCRLSAEQQVGDHVLLFGEVERVIFGTGEEALVYRNQTYHRTVDLAGAAPA
jgi:flavin reductase (DIM6/NTAB) family NADH-FMN oxidoreductase RutF